MRLVIQRVRSARVTVDGRVTGEISHGALVLVAVAVDDTPADILHLARKTALLRIFADDEGRMNNDISVAGGAFLVVSQFTLYGDCRKGNRPSYIESAAPEAGLKGYEEYVQHLREMGHEVQTGEFGAMMQVDLVNDGPVTLILESRGRA